MPTLEHVFICTTGMVINAHPPRNSKLAALGTFGPAVGEL